MPFDVNTISSVLLVYLIVVASPGINFVLISSFAISSSAAVAMWATAGIGAGATINAILTIIGVGALLAAFPNSENIIGAVGGSYLLYMGVTAIREARQRVEEPVDNINDCTKGTRYSSATCFSAFKIGIVTNLFNPKGLAFFLALYGPMVASATVPTKLAILAGGFTIEMAWYGTVVYFLSRETMRALYANHTKAFDYTLGGALAIMGGLLLADAVAWT